MAEELKFHRTLETISYEAAKWSGTSWAFIIALGLTLLWAVTGPFLGFSETWQLMMNTVSSIITFLMVFLLQRSQNKDSLAMQIKLNEIIAVLKGANNELINIEKLSEEEIQKIHERYQKLADKLQTKPHSTAAILTGDLAHNNALSL